MKRNQIIGVRENMARLPRFDLPGQPQHVLQRDNNWDVIFVAEADYYFYLENCMKKGKDF